MGLGFRVWVEESKVEGLGHRVESVEIGYEVRRWGEGLGGAGFRDREQAIGGRVENHG